VKLFGDSIIGVFCIPDSKESIEISSILMEIGIYRLNSSEKFKAIITEIFKKFEVTHQ
jgi:hypothetical protein